MYGTAHLLYTIISAVVGIALMIGFRLLFKKNDAAHRWVIRISALLTVAIHYSTLWVDFFTTGTATVDSTMLLPIYPCNIIMWLLLAVSFMKPGTVAYKLISEFVLWGGTVCGFIGIFLNENFMNNPNLLDYGVLKGLLSHSTMLIGCTYFFISGLVKIRVKNTVSVVAGLLFFLGVGGTMNLLYYIFGLPACNAMYLLSPPFEALPWLNTAVMGLAGVTLAFTLTVIYEQIALRAPERWYSKIGALVNNIKKQKGESN